MKKTLVSIAGAVALAVGVTALISSNAQASSPKSKFAAMKKALVAKQSQTNIKLKLSLDSSQKPKTLALVNGRFIPAQDGVPFLYIDGNGARVKTSISDIEDLTPEQRAQIEKAAKGEGRAIYINGTELSPEEAQAYLTEQGVRLNITRSGDGLQLEFDFGFDFNENTYSKMSFGRNENTLLLTPKQHADIRYSVVLDPKTNLPSTVVQQRSKAGKWTTVSNSTFVYKPKKK